MAADRHGNHYHWAYRALSVKCEHGFSISEEVLVHGTVFRDPGYRQHRDPLETRGGARVVPMGI